RHGVGAAVGDDDLDGGQRAERPPRKPGPVQGERQLRDHADRRGARAVDPRGGGAAAGMGEAGGAAAVPGDVHDEQPAVPGRAGGVVPQEQDGEDPLGGGGVGRVRGGFGDGHRGHGAGGQGAGAVLGDGGVLDGPAGAGGDERGAGARQRPVHGAEDGGAGG